MKNVKFLVHKFLSLIFLSIDEVLSFFFHKFFTENHATICKSLGKASKRRKKKPEKKTGSQGYHHQKPFLIVVLCARFSIFDPLSITMVMGLSQKNQTILTKSYQGNMY